MKTNYFGIGCFNMKTEVNYGTLFRTAQIFGADFIFLIGKRFKRMPSDTTNASKKIPLFEFKDFADFNEHRPYNCKLVGIELTDTAVPLQQFEHPKNAIYLLGSEDGGLSREALDACQSVVILPGEVSLNVAVAGSIVLYDRLTKIK